MADPQRARKMADRIKEVVARRLDKGLRDPRLGFVTITDVRVTGDLQHASIFYTVYGTDEERADSAAALKAATGMLRSEVGKNITARLTPSPSASRTLRPSKRGIDGADVRRCTPGCGRWNCRTTVMRAPSDPDDRMLPFII
jgi:ribosome-binding factor A